MNANEYNDRKNLMKQCANTMQEKHVKLHGTCSCRNAECSRLASCDGIRRYFNSFDLNIIVSLLIYKYNLSLYNAAQQEYQLKISSINIYLLRITLTVLPLESKPQLS